MKTNSIIDSLKRLEKVGEETRIVTQKLKKSAVEVAKNIIGIVENSGCFDIYNFEDSNDYNFIPLTKEGDIYLVSYLCNNKAYCHLCYSNDFDICYIGLPEKFAIDNCEATRERLLRFSKDIASRLLEKIIKNIEVLKVDTEQGIKDLENN